MRSKNLMAFLAIATVLFLVATVSAAEIAGNEAVYINSEYVLVGVDTVSVVAGETISIRVTFDALETDQDVTIEVELDGHKIDAKVVSSKFDVEAGKRYNKHLSLKIPTDLKDELSNDAELQIEIDGDEHKSVLPSIELRVQRQSENVEIMSIDTIQSAEAGQLLPVDIVLKNKGYNDVDDLYVTAKITALGVERTAYFGDLVALQCDEDDSDEENYGVDDINRKCDEDDEDTVSGRIYLQVPNNAKSGIYTLEVEVSGDDTTTTGAKQIVVESGFSGDEVIATVTGRTIAIGEDAEYKVLIVNPTNKLKVYKIIPESSNELSANVAESVVAIPAGSSKTVTITANAISEGTYNFNVNVFSGDELVSKVALSLNAEGKSVTTASPIVVLTVILAIIFIVLLIVLLVLLGKKPEKSEEFGESYY